MKVTAPKGLATGTRKFWSQVTTKYELRDDELRVLEDACREMDLVDRLQKELDGSPLMVEGSMRQLVPNPLISEVRQHRAVLQRLLAALKLPDEQGDGRAEKAAEDRSASARNAANARWGNQRGA